MEDTRLMIQLIGLMLTVPTSLLAYTDWKHRRRIHANHRPMSFISNARNTRPPWPPPPSTIPPAPPTSTIALPQPPIATVNGPALPLIRRIMSATIDGYLALTFAGVVGAVLSSGANLESDEWTGADTSGLLIVLVVMSLITANTGRSVGKLVFGGRVVMVNGQKLTFARAATRTMVAIFLGPLIVTYLAAIGDPTRRTLHDRLTKTWVMRTRQTSATYSNKC